MPSDIYRVSYKTKDGHQFFKSFSLKNMTREEAIKMGEVWKKEHKELHGNNGHGLERIPSESGSASNEKIDSVNNDGADSSWSLPRKEFTCLELPEEGGASFCFVGSTRSGKTTLIKAVHEHYFEDYISILHTMSPQANTYKELKKKVALAPSFCKEVINECIQINQRTNNHYNFCHIIDDVVSKQNDSLMIKLLTIGRNSYQNVLLSGQEISMLNATGRSNINFVFLGKLNNSMAVEKVVKQFCISIFPSDMTLVDKIKLYERLTANYNWIVIDCIENTAFLTKLSL